MIKFTKYKILKPKKLKKSQKKKKLLGPTLENGPESEEEKIEGLAGQYP